MEFYSVYFLHITVSSSVHYVLINKKCIFTTIKCVMCIKYTSGWGIYTFLNIHIRLKYIYAVYWHFAIAIQMQRLHNGLGYTYTYAIATSKKKTEEDIEHSCATSSIVCIQHFILVHML